MPSDLGSEAFDPVSIIEVLQRFGVRFVVIGGIAAISNGSPLPTEDLDVTPARDGGNLRCLARALRELEARLRVPRDGGEGVAFPVDDAMLSGAETWTLVTRFGDLDLAFSPSGTGGYEDLHRDATEVQLGDDPPVRALVASLADVIRSKEAANRPKDRAQLPALRLALDMIRDRERGAVP